MREFAAIVVRLVLLFIVTGCEVERPVNIAPVPAPAVAPATPTVAVPPVEELKPARLVGMWESKLVAGTEVEGDENKEFQKQVEDLAKTTFVFNADGTMKTGYAIGGVTEEKPGTWKLDRTDGETDYVQLRYGTDADIIEICRFKFTDDDHLELLTTDLVDGQGLKYTRIKP